MKEINFKIVSMLLFIIILSSFAYAEKGHMTLLTVGEVGNETVGGTADVYLEVKPGSGKIFIDSFPLTKIDTQISTRFAKEVACNFLEKDCSNLDFFYTIRAKSSVVGGPSAGAALTVLTVAVLENQNIDDSVVLTGTINSGGIIGPVAGIEEKVKAAKKEGFKKALIPKRSILSASESNLTNENNKTNITLVYSDSLKIEGIEVIPVSTLEDALFYLTGKTYPDYSGNLTIPNQYLDIMKNVSLNICGRVGEIQQLISKETKVKNFAKYNLSLDFMAKANVSFNQGDYYSTASFCFNANKNLREIEYSQYSDEELFLIEKEAEQNTKLMLDEINKKELKTISELETSIVVKERLFEAKDLLNENESDVLENLPYIVERIYSAKAWSAFFYYKGKEVSLDQEHLSSACLAKIAEAEERINYLELIFGEHVEFRKELYDVKKIYDSGDYAFCLFRASRLKADSGSILTSLSITDDKFQELLDDQLKLAKIQINKQREDFPIIGYSYYNYASSLRVSNPALSLVFSEYASEFSNLDMYFPQDKKFNNKFFVVIFDKQNLGIFLIGFAAGMLIVVVGIYLLYKIEKKRKKSMKQSVHEFKHLRKSTRRRK